MAQPSLPPPAQDAQTLVERLLRELANLTVPGDQSSWGTAPFGGGGATLDLALPSGGSTQVDIDFGGDGTGWILIAVLFGANIHAGDEPSQRPGALPERTVVSDLSSVRSVDVDPPPGLEVSLPFNISLVVRRARPRAPAAKRTEAITRACALAAPPRAAVRACKLLASRARMGAFASCP